MIAIFTDFGVQGPYLGQMRAVLLAQAPGVPVVDIFPDLPSFNVQVAAYLLPAYSQYLPDDSVSVCVVDPGVGSDRRALVVRADSRWYVGPDNGLFSILIRRAAQVHRLVPELCPFHEQKLPRRCNAFLQRVLKRSRLKLASPKPQQTV